jgi:hypothetical protein
MKIKKERQFADGKDGGTGGGARGLVLYKSLNTLWCKVSTRGKRDECKNVGWGAPTECLNRWNQCIIGSHSFPANLLTWIIRKDRTEYRRQSTIYES